MLFRSSHWRESTLGNELMTGYLNSGTNPLSAITVGAMADLGYAVSFNAADAYAKPAAASRTSSSSSSSSAARSTAALMGPFVKAMKDDHYYGEILDGAVKVTASNSVNALSAGATTVAYAHTVYVEQGVTRSGIDFGNRKTSSPTPTPTPTPAPTPTPTPSGSGASIAGTVYTDTNGNGAKDSGEPALSGWRVYLDTNRNGAYDSGERNVVTGSSGAYSFTGVAAGTYNVRQVDQGGWNRTNSTYVLTVSAGQSITGKNFGNFKSASIAGRVFNDADRDGVQDAGEAGLSGIRVYDDKNNNGRYDSGERSTTTNSSGNYTLGSLSAGQRTVRVVLSGRTIVSPSAGYHRLTPTSGQVITGKNFATRTSSSVRLVAAADTQLLAAAID